MEWFPVGAKWHYESGNTSPLNPVYSHHFIVEKDTVIEGKTCRLISGDNTKNAVYEENGCVYYFFNDKFRKMYDFSVDVGDVVDLEFKVYMSSHGKFDTTLIIPCYVEKVISKFINGMELKEIHTSYSIDIELSPDDLINQAGQFIYLEKVGCERPGLIGGEFIPHIGSIVQVPEYYYELKNYYDPYMEYVSNIPLYKSNSAIKIYPNPVKDRLTISNEIGEIQNEVLISIYDMAGRVVLKKRNFIPCELNLKHLVSGIYFIRIMNDTECLMSDKLVVK